MLLMVGEGIRQEICHSICWYAKANNKYPEQMNKTILKSKNIKSEAFREYSHLQVYVASKKNF